MARLFSLSISLLLSLACVAALALTLTACGGGEAVVPPADDPVIVRQDDGRLWIRWRTAPEGRVRVHVGNDPGAIERTEAIGELKDGELLTPRLPKERRPYFALAPENGPTVIVAERLLPLEGAHNFRDLGGYRTADGRRVRWGRVYRSDHLGDLSDEDLAYLERLGIRTLCDFRSAIERESSPDRLEPPLVVNPDISDDRFAMDELQERILTGRVEDVDWGNLLVEGNSAFARDYTEQYTTFFSLFEDAENLPVVFHCTAGKDRAGFAAALLLSALGVPRETVIADYMLTQPYTQDHIEGTLRVIRFASLFRTDTELIRPLFGVRLEYIGAAFDSAEAGYGSMDAYLEQALELTPEKRNALRELLLR